ncbi:MAG: DUF4124 domain-containing protein [Pseudomonadales bacterium]|nr:DUF4124 domain-containing protein [Pseudomonadales bacterium]
MKSSIYVYTFAVVLSSVLFCATYPVNAQVFKYKDEQGNIVYSDTPPPLKKQSTKASKDTPLETVDVPEVNSFESVQEPYTPELLDPDAPKMTYESVQITSPANDSALRDNAGSVTVTITSLPAISADHRYQLFLDDKNTQLPSSNTFHLVNVDRGTHTLRIDIVDQQQQLIKSSEPSVFHLQRYSKLN